MNSSINQYLQKVRSSAAQAAGEARTAVKSVSRSVADKYDVVKLRVEYAKLSDEQEDVFGDIGHMLYLMHTGAVGQTVTDGREKLTPQQLIDALLIRAQQIGQEMEFITDRIKEAEPRQCPACGHVYGEKDVFCARCGRRLGSDGDSRA